jgi:hypothetical protein
MKNDYDISRQQQDDLIKAYNKVAPLSWSQEDAYKKAVKEPAPRYYVSPKQALQIISPMVKGDFERVNMMMPNRKRMYYSLFEKVIELSEKRSFVGKSLFYIMHFAVLCPAPEFFVGYRKVAEVRSFIKRGLLTDEGRVINHKGRAMCYEKLKKRRAELKAYRAQFK